MKYAQSLLLAFLILSIAFPPSFSHAFESGEKPKPKVTGKAAGISSTDEIKRNLDSDPALLNEDDTSYLPASTSKVFTSMTALKMLGENFQYETPIYWNTISSDTISELRIRGGGDPTWTFWDDTSVEKSPFYPLILKLQQMKVKQIVGPILFESVDATHLDRRGSVDVTKNEEVKIPKGWDQSEKHGEYLRKSDEFGIIPGSFYYHLKSVKGVEIENGETFNVITFGCSKDAPKDEAQSAYRTRFPFMTVDCSLPYVFDSELQNKKDNGEPTGAKWNRFGNREGKEQGFVYAAKPGSGFPVTALLPLTTGESVLRIRENLTNLLRLNGIKVVARNPLKSVAKGEGSFDPQVIIKSAPLKEILTALMHDSINRIAESLVVQIGIRSLVNYHRLEEKDSDAYEQGLTEIRAYANELAFVGAKTIGGLVSDKIEIDDGCGLSRTSQVSPRYMVQVLEGIKQINQGSVFLQFKSIAAQAGGDGTMHGYRSASGEAFGKTGTLNDTFNLVGFVKDVDGVGKLAKVNWVPFAIYSGVAKDRSNYLTKMIRAAEAPPFIKIE